MAHPDILGPDILIVSFEFDRWLGRTGTRERDRLDVLGLDSTGRLVVAELKRDRAPDTVDMQAVKYAALASRFTEETLVEHFARFRAPKGETPDEDAARDALLAHAGELDGEQLRRPRIVLVAGWFPPVVTSTVVWLTSMGLDISLQRIQAYRVADGQIIVTVVQDFPIADIEEFIVSPERAQLKAMDDKRSRSREQNTVARLVTNDLLEDGITLTLKPITDVNADIRSSIEEWITEDPRRASAIWHNDLRQPLEWSLDGGRYSPTELVRHILREAAGVDRSVRGPRWWTTADGRHLPEIAGAARGSRFDWSRLHEVLLRISPGSWTTYGDLARAIGTAPVPLGQHVATCLECPNAYRVLGADGRPRPNFRWDDADETRSQQEVLQEEGVSFTDGVAEPRQRLDAGELTLRNRADI
jgi:alkylated DNA nucleotide flippase Atl1